MLAQRDLLKRQHFQEMNAMRADLELFVVAAFFGITPP